MNHFGFTALAAILAMSGWCLGAENKAIRAGAAEVNISPESYPVIVNGGFLEATANGKIRDLFARAIVLGDGSTQIALVVVDSCMMPRDFLDQVKKLAQETTGIPASNIMISATHTHTAPSVMGALGARPDEKYKSFLMPQIVRAITLASGSMAPARVGSTVFQDADHTNCRRWIYQPDKMLVDPFGNKSVRANMHPGHLNPNTIGPSGPVDTALTMLAIQGMNGTTIAVLANYSMHYYGSSAVSPDYYGVFCESLSRQIREREKNSKAIAIMSQGTSGDLMWMDYGKQAPKRDIQVFADEIARRCSEALKTVRYEEKSILAMEETRIRLKRRVPDQKRLEWANNIIQQMKNPVPKSREEVYALEQRCLYESPEVELKLQAIRVGGLGIATLPNEVFGITGLKIKKQSPLPLTMNIELANGSEGYIPPPEQHALGGYTTWPARTAALEIQAEPRIVEVLLKGLETVSKGNRKSLAPSGNVYSNAILQAKPAAYWRFEDMDGTVCSDLSPHGQHGTYQDGKAFYLTGPRLEAGEEESNRAVHFAGGKMSVKIPQIGETYSVEGWIWNGLPVNSRPVTGYFFSRGKLGQKDAPGDHLGVGGTSKGQGKLIFFNGNSSNQLLVGNTPIPIREWVHIALVRSGKKVTVYLNGKLEIEGEADVTTNHAELSVGGRCDGFSNWEGKLDEFAIYPGMLSKQEIEKRFVKQLFLE